MLLKLKLRAGVIIMILGALFAGVGEGINLFNALPTTGGWFLSIGLVVLGTLLLVYGMNMYVQLSEDINLLGVLSSGLLFLGGIVVIVATVAINAIVLPLLFGLATTIAATINSLTAGISQAANTVSSGLSNIGNSIANAFDPGSGNASIPSANIPQVNGVQIVNSSLTSMKAPTIDQIGQWGHFFMTAGPLAVGVLLLGLSFLRVKAFPKQTAGILIVGAALDLVSQFLTFLPILASIASILLFLSLIWLGISVLFPDLAQKSFALPAFSRKFKASLKRRTSVKHLAS